jgi:hypothetical protein
MKGRRPARVFLRTVLIGLALPAAAATPPPCASQLARCTGLVAADERLACFDALARPTASRAHEVPADAGRSTSGAAAASDASGDTAAKTFGLSRHQLQAVPEGPELIKARVAKVTEDRRGNVSVLLDNGQTWAVTEPDAPLRAGDPVTIKRAALGSFLMITAARHSYRIRRVQ